MVRQSLIFLSNHSASQVNFCSAVRDRRDVHSSQPLGMIDIFVPSAKVQKIDLYPNNERVPFSKRDIRIKILMPKQRFKKYYWCAN